MTAFVFALAISTTIYISIFIVIIGIIGIGGWIIYFLYSRPKLRVLAIFMLLGYLTHYWLVENNTKSYRYWYQLMDKNPKPWNVSFKEFSRKNREGYCWVDRKTYTKEELKEKAIVSYVEMELLKMKSLKEGWMRSIGGSVDYEEVPYLSRFFSGSDCGRFGCKIQMISPLLISRSPIFEKSQKLMQESIQKNTEINQEIVFNSERRNLLSELGKVNSIEIKDDRDFLSYIKKHDNFIIASMKTNDRKLSLMFSTNIFIVSNQDKNTDKGKFQIYGSLANKYFPASSIPKNIDVHDYGVGLYYLVPKKIYLYEEDVSYKESAQKNSIKVLFSNLDNSIHNPVGIDNNIYYPINNCGDLLIKPAYVIKLK
ncbi:hypothetical protein [Stenoxybacter acetivorans]|uniref:hypothetical protein n=1 Tax=Stenoxybacter acetivorans TaxID=422441 RepID=UPI0005637774|nr:hypothetical protein [Stenoxybacter acetivorans]